MSEKSNHPEIEKMVKEGIAAIKDGDRQLGRGKLEAAIHMDQYNELAWMWLALIADTVEERSICLGNVVLINPQNEKAQAMLEKLKGRSGKIKPELSDGKEGAKVMGLPLGVLLIAGGALGLLLVIVLAVVVLSSGGDDAEPEAAVLPTDTPLPISAGGDTDDPQDADNALDSAEDEPTLIPPTPTNTPRANPPTWTPTAGPTETPPPQTFPSPPADMPGRIIMQSGNSPGDPNNQPIAVISPADLNSKLIVSPPNLRGQNPALVSGENIFAWAQYSSGTRSLTVQIQRFNRDDSLNVVTIYDNDPPKDQHNQPAWSSDGRYLVYSARTLSSPYHDLWLIEVPLESAATPLPTFSGIATDTPSPTPTLTPIPTLAPDDEEDGEGLESVGEPEPADDDQPPSPALTRLTNDSLTNTWPRFNPSDTALVYVADNEGQIDLRVLDVARRQAFILTNNGNQLIESAPDWGLDDRIVFSASTTPNGPSDLYVMQADGSGEPQLLLDLGPHDIKPRWSPDGRYIVFSSDFYGNFDVFIYDTETKAIYAVETTPNSVDIANDWAE